MLKLPDNQHPNILPSQTDLPGPFSPNELESVSQTLLQVRLVSVSPRTGHRALTGESQQHQESSRRAEVSEEEYRLVMSSLLTAYVDFATPDAIVGSSMDSYKANNMIAGPTGSSVKAAVDSKQHCQSLF